MHIVTLRGYAASDSGCHAGLLLSWDGAAAALGGRCSGPTSPVTSVYSITCTHDQ